ncbi:hypothetical protein FG386_002590 [Cryptosporidium ryanae]|uniref:uncharacterized protein n=1 Tax=Cryptosporidium ryanae TaxID=515981 RepID=UPI00351A748D|nr:hypothetical protein FG386_002590 [Cryptosporidium ryanae]
MKEHRPNVINKLSSGIHSIAKVKQPHVKQNLIKCGDLRNYFSKNCDFDDKIVQVKCCQDSNNKRVTRHSSINNEDEDTRNFNNQQGADAQDQSPNNVFNYQDLGNSSIQNEKSYKFSKSHKKKLCPFNCFREKSYSECSSNNDYNYNTSDIQLITKKKNSDFPDLT